MPEQEIVRHSGEVKPLIIHSNKRRGFEKALDMINPETGEHMIPKYESFCLDYVHHFTMERAMLAAGYPEDRTKQQMINAFRRVMLRHDVQLRVQALIREKANQMGVSSDWVVMKWMEVLDRCMQKEQVKDQKGNFTGEWKFDARGANIVLENLAKYFGMFVNAAAAPRPVQINVNFGGRAPNEKPVIEVTSGD